MLESPEAKFAVFAVREAARLSRYVQGEMVTPALTKDDRSPVTVADFAAQAVVARRLEMTFPDDPLVGEENASTLRTPEGQAVVEQVTGFVRRVIPEANNDRVCEWIDRGAAEPAKRFWTLDPIDGTKGFLRGDQYAVCLALIEDGKVKLGVLGCPNLGDCGRSNGAGEGSLLLAVAGKGSSACSLEADNNFQPIHVNSEDNPQAARLLRSFESGHTNDDQMVRLVEALDTQAEPVRMDSQAKYAVLAAGAGELYFRLLSANRPDYREKIWDQAAGSLVIEEAGGRVTDLDGKPLDFSAGRSLENNRGVVASNGVLHDAALAAVRAISA